MSDPGFELIVADPPWPETGGGGRGAQRHYNVVPYSDIPTVVLSAPCWRPSPSSWFGVWTTVTSLPRALALLDAAGFKYVTTWTWVKTYANGELHLGMGQYGRHGAEFILWGRRGQPGRAPAASSQAATFLAPVLEHSRKPDTAFAAAEQTFRHHPARRLEMFARGPRAGWTVWGAEASP